MIYSELIGAKWKRIPLPRINTLIWRPWVKAVDGDTRMIFICNPNNPTGTYIPKAETKSVLREIWKNVPHLYR